MGQAYLRRCAEDSTSPVPPSFRSDHRPGGRSRFGESAPRLCVSLSRKISRRCGLSAGQMIEIHGPLSTISPGYLLSPARPGVRSSARRWVSVHCLRVLVRVFRRSGSATSEWSDSPRRTLLLAWRRARSRKARLSRSERTSLLWASNAAHARVRSRPWVVARSTCCLSAITMNSSSSRGCRFKAIHTPDDNGVHGAVTRCASPSRRVMASLRCRSPTWMERRSCS